MYILLTQQLAARLEAVAGTVETLTAADVKLRPFQSEFGFAPQFQRFGNDQVAEDLSAAADFVAGIAGQIKAGFPLQTSGVVGTEPAIGIYLEACGMKKEVVRTITISAPTGGGNAFAAGDTWTSGAKAGKIEQDISIGGALRYVLNSGSSDLVATDVITATDGTSATASGTSAAYAVKYTPRSTGQKNLTIQRMAKHQQGTATKDRIWRLRGAMGTGTIGFAALDAARFAGEFSGPLDYYAMGDLFTGVTYEAVALSALPKLINSTIQINGVAVKPSSVQLDLGRKVELDPDPTTTGGLSGYDAAFISGFEPKITIDPLTLPTDVLHDLDLLKAGTEVAFSLIMGTTPQLIELSALKCQVREDTEGNRVGRQVQQLTLHIVRNNLIDNDFALLFR